MSEAYDAVIQLEHEPSISTMTVGTLPNSFLL